ncbi:hypothetical protein NDU88_007398 [Pleurodeles waltl]|uniref:Uncharacterized protein n=1 Tax=Pleurodeles waltl TaxID=8319 RepID=A0AAV7PL61_PLEWA|nr:hypothetical protein NDU88_007398 [Pleurodeles waltl]
MGEDTSVTRHFLEYLFGTLRADKATLRQEMAADIKEVKREVGELGQRVDGLEQSGDAREEEELVSYQRQLLSRGTRMWTCNINRKISRTAPGHLTLELKEFLSKQIIGT